jgi:replicative DNA helicase
MPTEPELPQAVEAEQAVIGALLRENGAVDRLGNLSPSLFYRHDHRLIYTEVLRQIMAGKGCDVISVGLALAATVPDAMPYLNEMAQSCPSAANIGHHAELVRDRALRRALLQATSEAAELAQRPGGRSALQVLDQAQGALAALAVTRAAREPLRACEAMVLHMETIEARAAGLASALGIATGFDDLDRVLEGGPGRGNLVIIAARPSMGKTALAVNIACNVAGRGLTALVLSMEMQNGELLDRALATVGSIPLAHLRSGQMVQAEWARFVEANARISEMGLYLDDQPALTLLDVCGKARQVKRRHGLDLLVVDYLQLMSGDGNARDNRNAQVEAISRGLKALAKELDCPVLALSQLNRNGARERPQLTDLRDSGAIEQDADIVVFVHRDEVGNPNSHLRGFADLFVAKNRQGAIDDVMLEYEGLYTRFINPTRRRPPDPKAALRDRKGLAAALPFSTER